MFRIVRNECLRRARRARRGDDLAHSGAVVSAEDDVLQRLEAQRVAAAIAESSVVLEIGTTVPDLALEDTEGHAVRLADYRGKDNVLVYSARSTTCPVCNSHVKDLAQLTAADVRVLVAVPERSGEAAAWRAKRKLPFQVVTGRQGTPHEAVGLLREVCGALQQSGSLLIDRDGVIRPAHAATVPTHGYDKKGITEAIRVLSAQAPGGTTR